MAGEEVVDCDAEGVCQGDDYGDRGLSSALFIHGYGARAEPQGVGEG